MDNSRWLIQFYNIDASRFISRVALYQLVRKHGLEIEFGMVYTDSELDVLTKAIEERSCGSMFTDMQVEGVKNMELMSAVAFLENVLTSITKIGSR